MEMDKSLLSEEDIKHRYITPALERVWPASDIRMELAITAGRVNIKGNMEARERPKFADYVLYTESGHPLAVVEAKDNNHTISFGMQQAKAYAQMMDLPFAYSSNGDGFVEYDFLTGIECELSLDAFPTPAELIARFKEEGHLTEEQVRVIEQPFYVSEGTFAPRYYQRVAVDRTLDAIAADRSACCSSWRRARARRTRPSRSSIGCARRGLGKKILYLADRNILVDQSIQQDFRPLAGVIHKVNYASDDRTTITSYEVYFSLYQQLFGENDEERFRELFRPDFFDLIVVDECHAARPKPTVAGARSSTTSTRPSRSA